MAQVLMKNLTKKFDDVVAVDRVNLDKIHLFIKDGGEAIF